MSFSTAIRYSDESTLYELSESLNSHHYACSAHYPASLVAQLGNEACHAFNATWNNLQPDSYLSIGNCHQHLPIGEGNLPLSDVLNRFALNGYRGVAVVEEFIPRFSTAYYLEKALAYQAGMQHLRASVQQNIHAG